MMKEDKAISLLWKLFIAIFITTLVIPIICCTGLYLNEWTQHEESLQEWLGQNDQRVDFFYLHAIYPSNKQLREVLLKKLPVGSSEEEVRAFYFANEDNGWGVWEPSQYSEENLVRLEIYEGSRGHGHFLQRVLLGG